MLRASFSLHRSGQEHPRSGASTVQNRQGYCNCCHVHYSNLEQVRQLLHNLAADSKEYLKALSAYKISVSTLNNQYWVRNKQFVNCTMCALRKIPCLFVTCYKRCWWSGMAAAVCFSRVAHGCALHSLCFFLCL